VLLPGEHPDEVPEHHAEPVLRLGRRQLGDLRLAAEDELDRGDHLHDELRVDPEGVEQPLLPVLDPVLGLGEDLEHELAEGLDEGGVGDVALVGIELPRGEGAPHPDDRLLELVDERRLADAGVAGDEHELRCASGDHAIEALEQEGNLRLSTIELLRDLEALGGVPLAQGERLDPPAGAPLREAPLQIALEAARALVAVLGHLGEQLQDDTRERFGHRGDDLRWRHGRAGDVAVDPLDGIARLEGEPPGEHLVEGDTQGVQIGAVVDRPVRPPRLLRGEVGQRALEEAGRLGGLVLAGEAGGEAEVGDLHLAGREVDDDVVRLEILVDDAALVDARDGAGDTDREGEEALEGHGRAEQGVEGAAAEVLEDEGGHALVSLEGERLDDGGRVDDLADLVFVLEPGEILGAAPARIEHLEDHRAAVGASNRAVEGGPAALVERLGHGVDGSVIHG
jgi:hypothetical protein